MRYWLAAVRVYRREFDFGPRQALGTAHFAQYCPPAYDG